MVKHMKKIITASVLSIAMASTSFAGSAVYVAPIEPMIEEPERMGSSIPWWIPIVIIGGIVILTRCNEPRGCEGQGG